MILNIRQLLEDGHAKLKEQHAAKEVALRGHPRIGTSGIVTEDGQVHGTCHRKALARNMGLELPAELYTDLMWKGGEANEGHWERIIALGLPEGYSLTPRDATDVKAAIEGVEKEVLGHPDMVIRDSSGADVMGFELKGIFGYSTAVQVFFEGTPKNENLIQAAAYSAALGLPYALCYTSYCYTSLNFYDKKKYGVSSIKPFYCIFYMEWRGDELWYRDERKTEWVRTSITSKGIEDYYRLVQEMKQAEDLGPRVNSHYVNGTDNKWGEQSACGLCEFKAACDRYDVDRDFDSWIGTVKQVCTE